MPLKQTLYGKLKIMDGYGKITYPDMGNNPMVGATVACAVAVEEALK